MFIVARSGDALALSVSCSHSVHTCVVQRPKPMPMPGCLPITFSLIGLQLHRREQKLVNK